MPTTFVSLPHEMRLEIFKQLPTLEDAVAFRYVDLTNSQLITEKFFRLHFLTPKEQRLLSFFADNSRSGMFKVLDTTIITEKGVVDCQKALTKCTESSSLSQKRTCLHLLRGLVRRTDEGEMDPGSQLYVGGVIQKMREGKFILAMAEQTPSWDGPMHDLECLYQDHLHRCIAEEQRNPRLKAAPS
ncbi:hypothetical protein BJ508DRAFT_307531 [Ascobolus immersus RN42]|uniref:F-box domain-containing protein n=1 Tax=Ascobolus immersus RN42 TaxID=1160509 RepID=A0A3N4I6L4_ASCIM|nr:hypothetical protein BJ508DRAFT_307531 [Ascobolus immersus RN42]